MTLLPFLRAYLSARWRFRHLRGAALERFQNERAQIIVTYAKKHSTFYRAHFAGHDDWRSAPPIDKAVMMANFDTFNTGGVRLDEAMNVALRAERDRNFAPTLGGMTVGLSSGTSGHRGLFLVDRSEQLRWAGTILARALPQPRRGLRLAFFLRSNSNLYETLGRWITFRYFDLMLPIGDAVTQLNDYQPHIVVGPPSLLGLLADSPELHIQPERLISVAEVLEPQDEARLVERFGASVHQIYQCTEGLLAVSCERGAVHIQEDLVALQFEPAGDGRVIPIVTDLWRRTQPILRYRLNDVLTLAADPCACGSAFRVIERIEGRCDDICYFPEQGGDALRPLFPDALRRMVLLSDDRIEDYQIEQESPGTLRVRLEVKNGFEEVAARLRATIAAELARYGCKPAAVKIERGLAPRPASEKRRRVRRLGIMSPA
jgi:phenylacetate-CoA ligase